MSILVFGFRDKKLEDVGLWHGKAVWTWKDGMTLIAIFDNGKDYLAPSVQMDRRDFITLRKAMEVLAQGKEGGPVPMTIQEIKETAFTATPIEELTLVTLDM